MVECMFLTRPDEFHVLHEPMGESWYYSKERVHKRFSQETCEESEHWDYTYDKVRSVILARALSRVGCKGQQPDDPP